MTNQSDSYNIIPLPVDNDSLQSNRLAQRSEYVQIMANILEAIAAEFGLTYKHLYSQVNDLRANTVGQLVVEITYPESGNHPVTLGCKSIFKTWTSGNTICLTCMKTGLSLTFDIADPNSLQSIKSFIFVRYYHPTFPPRI